MIEIDQLEYERVDDETADEDATVQEFHDNKPLYPGVYEDGFDFGTDDHVVNWDQIGKDNYTSGIWNPDEINNEATKLVFPAPAAKAGFTAMWRNVETGELYLATEIPELTAATYEAYYAPIATN